MGGPFCFYMHADRAQNRAMRRLILVALLTLGACGAPADKAAGGVTQSEADALNAAAAKIDRNDGAR